VAAVAPLAGAMVNEGAFDEGGPPMAKDRPIPEDPALTAWLRTGEGTLPDALREDAERGRAALSDRRVDVLAGLAKEVQAAAVAVLTEARDAELLVALEGATPFKEVRKLVGKARFLLKNKGVAVPEAPRGEAFKFHTVEGEEARSYASLVDPDGDRMVWFGAQVKKRGRMAFQAVINETSGIGLFQVFPQMTAKMRRRILDELLGSKIPVYEVDNAYARWLIEEAARRNEASGTDIPKEYFEAKPLMGEAPDLSADPHPVYGLLLDQGAAGEPTPTELRAARDLFDLEEIQSWSPAGDVLEKLQAQQDLSSQSVLVLTEKQRREQHEAELERAARGYFVGEVRTRWSRRLLDLAHWLIQRDQVSLARAALAAAEHLAAPESDAGANPFAVELFRRASTRAETPVESQEPGAEEGSTILTP
jgi:hypothetical protein